MHKLLGNQANGRCGGSAYAKGQVAGSRADHCDDVPPVHALCVGGEVGHDFDSNLSRRVEPESKAVSRKRQVIEYGFGNVSDQDAAIRITVRIQR